MAAPRKETIATAVKEFVYKLDYLVIPLIEVIISPYY